MLGGTQRFTSNNQNTAKVMRCHFGDWIIKDWGFWIPSCPSWSFPYCLLALKRQAAMLQTSCPQGFPTWPQNNRGAQVKSLLRGESCQLPHECAQTRILPHSSLRRLEPVRPCVGLQGWCHKVPLTGWFKQQEFIFLHFWRLDI